MESIPLQELLLPWTPYSGLVISDRARQERAVMHHVKFIHRFSEGHGKVLRPVKMENGGTTVRVRCPNGEKKYHFNKAQIAEMEKGYNPLIVLEYLRKVQPDILRTHTGEKPFACKHLDCTYRTAQTSNLTRHMCTHTGELFACTHIGCTYRTAQTGHLTEHRRTHTGELFACKQCGYRTAYKSVLKTHMRTHTGEKPFACKHLDCTYRTTQTSNLTRHMRTHR